MAKVTYLCGHNNPNNNYGYRKCCYKCWKSFEAMVNKGEVTWNQLISQGKCGLLYRVAKLKVICG